MLHFSGAFERLTNIGYRDYDFRYSRRASTIGEIVESSFLNLSFGSQLYFLDVVQDVSENFSRMLGFDDDGRYWVSLSVRESVTNAILHGNKQDENKQVALSFVVEGGRLIICVQDEGEGFDEASLPDPLDPSNLLKPSGRGIFYVRSFMDEVRYRNLPGGGWEVRMEKRLNHQQEGETQ